MKDETHLKVSSNFEVEKSKINDIPQMHPLISKGK